MKLTSRRRRPLDRKITSFRDTRLVIIATEGSSTEKQYFSIFTLVSARVQIRILETQDGHSSPQNVLNRLRTYRREYDLGKDDFLCLVIDKDRWTDGMLAEVASQARNLGFLLALSNPCFEVWLLLHHNDLTSGIDQTTCRQIEDKLRAILSGYDKANLPTERFEPLVDAAVRRAKNLDIDPGARWPNQTGTRVYRVIEAIRERM